jgi:hypothetical protein
MTLLPGQLTPLPPVGYPTAGVWFDFLHPDEDGLPAVGCIENMAVNGVAPLRGPGDTGTFIWGSGAIDLTGQFGISFADFGAPITVTFSGKSDFFTEELGTGSPDSVKNVDNVALLLSLSDIVPGEVLSFILSLTADLYSSLQSFIESEANDYEPGTQAVVGTAIVGSSVIGSPNAAQQFQIVRGFAQANVRGRVIQTSFQESSYYPWTVLGYIARLSSQEATIP